MKKIIIISLILVTSVLNLSSLEVPKLKGRVNDYANILSSSEQNRLESEIKSLESGTSSQIAILTINSLEGDSLEDFSIRTVDEWKLGTKGNDNGVLLLISLADKSIRLEVGYGLEGTLTDAKSDYIIRNIISPAFRKGNIYSGLSEATQAISGTISGEYNITKTDIKKSRDNRRSGGSPSSLIFVVLFLIFSTLGRRGVRGRRGGRGLASAMILSSLLGGSSRGSSGGSGGGFGGGGFSGGGGGFGGGGASGGW